MAARLVANEKDRVRIAVGAHCYTVYAKLVLMPYADPKVQAEWMRKWIARRRRNWLSGKCCKICESTVRLEIDHIDPATKADHRIWSWSPARRDAELEKCQVLCKKCHQNKTRLEGPRARHGFSAMYGKYKCRCDVCRAWKKKVNAKRTRT